jgi:hypothetical protein
VNIKNPAQAKLGRGTLESRVGGVEFLAWASPQRWATRQRAGTTNACATDFVRKNKSCVSSIATHPCKERKDGPPSVRMMYTRVVEGGPPAPLSVEMLTIEMVEWTTLENLSGNSPRPSRKNADDGLSLDPIGPVEGGDGIVEGGHFADVCPQSTIADPLDDLSQLGAIGYDDEVDS